jgi:protein phosphatase
MAIVDRLRAGEEAVTGETSTPSPTPTTSPMPLPTETPNGAPATTDAEVIG